MWLDRFSGHSTPSGSPPPPQNRSYSPAPRRPSHLASEPRRPSFTPRSSSLNPGARLNQQSNSLNSPRLPNGSNLKQQMPPPADTIDPLSVLEEIVGRPIQKEALSNGITDSYAELERPSQLFEDVDFNGQSLQAFAAAGPGEIMNGVPGNQRVSTQTVVEYEKEKDNFEDLHRSILACDDVLKSVGVSLASFQKDLGVVSAEIETLQSRSTALNTKLENRRVVEKLLGPAVEEVSIAPVVVKKISEGPIDLAWTRALEELERRSKVINGKMKGPDVILAVSDIKPLLDDLTNRAVERIRDFFVSQIKALRSPNINAQIIQQQYFLKSKDLYAFLVRHHPQLADELSQAYINTMRWYYSSQFARYHQALDKISLTAIDKPEALGADPANQRGNLISTVKTSQASHDAIILGRRIDVVERPNSSALSSYLAEDSKSGHYIETPFYNFNLALIDNASAEYSFLTTFFSNNSFHQVSRQFATIFDPTFALGQSLTKKLVETSYDCLGILICVRLNQHFAFELQRRKVPVADGYINGTNMLLWPRFQLAMDNHCESIRRATSAISDRSTVSALSLTSGADAATKQSTAPHVLTQRFGQFLQGVLALSSDAGDEEPVGHSLSRMTTELKAFLTKIAKGLGVGGRRERFLANNYSLVLTIIGDTKGRLADEQREHFESLKDTAGS